MEKIVSPWTKKVEDIYKLLSTTVHGISEEEALTRYKQVGPNEFNRRKKQGAFSVFLKQFSSPLIFILIGAALLTILLKEWVDTFVILIAVVVNAVLGFYQEYKAEQTLEKLTSYIKEETYVVRSRGEREIESSMLVPGDIIRLSLGMRVPADARIISTNSFAVDESILTGESLPIRKKETIVSEGTPLSERDNMIHAGSLVVEGYATAVVVATGADTEIGHIAELVRTNKIARTPLQKALSRLAWIILVAVVVVVTGLFFLGLAQGQSVVEMLLLSSAVIVGSVPEGLPIALTVILTAGVARIAKKKGIVRNLSAAETLGSTTVVLTDKTGTLTEAKMQFMGVLTKESLLSEKRAIDPKGKDMLDLALLATDAFVENPEEPKKEWRFLGRALESNIARAASDAGIDVLELVEERRLPVLPFNSKYKFSVAYDQIHKQYAILGAPDILLARADISKDEYVTLSEKINEVSSEGKRIVGVARMKDSALDHTKGVQVEDVKDVEFLGLIVLYDPIRKDVPDAIKRIESHGVEIIMITGDLKGTAMAIATELGWEVSGDMVMTGTELRGLDDETLSRRLREIKIFARVTPEDKLRVGRLYKSLGEVVAMTGDGVNDAPALKTADIGVAPGSGSDVAKGVADLVLLDDNFNTIVYAIDEGRRVIANIRKAFVYLMSNSSTEVVLVGGSLLLGLPLPLTALQIIWMNFFTESLPALSYAFEENRDVQKSSGAQKAIFNREVGFLTIGVGIFASVALFVLYWGLLQYGIDETLARTVLFACFSSYVLGVAFSFKSLRKSLFSYNWFDNKAFNWSMLAATLFIVSSFVIPFLREALQLTVLPLVWLLVVIGWIIFNVLVVEIVKWWFRRV